MDNKFSRITLAAFVLSSAFAQKTHAYNGVPNLLPFEGRLTDSAGSVLNYPVTVAFRIYPPSGNCYIYEDTQTVSPTAYGLFSILLGSPANLTGPANSFLQVFNNDVQSPLTDSCSGTYTPAVSDWRRIEVVVNGTPMPQMQTIGASAFAMNSQTLEGLPASAFIQSLGTVTQANLSIVTGGGDASSQHNHNSLYARIDGSNAYTGSISTNAKIYAPSATSALALGTSTPSADIDIEKNSPSIRLGATAGGGGTERIDFYSGSTPRASILSPESSSMLQFFTGSTEAMRLDSAQNAKFFGSLSTSGTISLGQYTDTTEAALITALTALGTAAEGTLWMNTTSNSIRYWDGVAATSLSSTSSSSGVTSVTAGNGLSNSGTAAAPVLNALYGTAANTAIQGNATFAGDVNGPYTALSVDKLKGLPIDFTTAPATNQVLTFNASGNWVPGTLPSAAVSLGYTPVNKAGDAMSGLLVLSADPTAALGAATKQYVDTGLATKQNALGYAPVNKAGDTMTGLLVLSADPVASIGAATKQYVDTSISTAGGAFLRRDGTIALNADWDVGAHKLANLADPTLAQDASTKNYVDTGLAAKQAALGFTPVNKAGDTLTGNLALSAATTLSLGVYSNAQEVTLSSGLAATDKGKTWFNTNSNQVKYWDGAAVQAVGSMNGGVSKSGDTMTGLLVLSADPSIALGAATKQYVDSSVNTSGASSVKKDGTVALTADWDVGAHKLKNLIDPTLAQDASTKNYVDTGLATKQNALGFTPVNKTGDTMSGALVVSGPSVTTSSPVVALSQTWNASGQVFTANRLNVTNTASAAGSMLMDLQVGGVSEFNVQKDGTVAIASTNMIDSTGWIGTTIPLNKGGTGQSTKTAAFDGLSPTTTKGDVIVSNGTNNVRVAIGSDGQVFQADSTQASGLKWATPTGAIFSGNAAAVTVASASTKYMIPNDPTTSSTESAKQLIMPVAGHIRDFFVFTTTAQTGTGSLVVNLRKNGVDQAVTFTVAAGAAAATFSDTTNTVTVAAGDKISIKLVNNGTAASAGINGISFRLVP